MSLFGSVLSRQQTLEITNSLSVLNKSGKNMFSASANNDTIVMDALTEDIEGNLLIGDRAVEINCDQASGTCSLIFHAQTGINTVSGIMFEPTVQQFAIFNGCNMDGKDDV